MNARRRRLARTRRSVRATAHRTACSLRSYPKGVSGGAIRLALACGWWALASEPCPSFGLTGNEAVRGQDRWDADRAKEQKRALGLLEGRLLPGEVGTPAPIDYRAALKDLATRPFSRMVARDELKKAGLPIVPVRAFGPGWEALGTVTLN